MTGITSSNDEKETPTDFSEGGELLPAGDEGAGATEAVTLAGDLHVVDDGLRDDVHHIMSQPTNWIRH